MNQQDGKLIKENLAKKIGDKSSEVRRRAVATFITFDPDDIIDLIIDALSDDDWRVRKKTISILSCITPSKILLEKMIESIIQEENIGLRNAAAEVIGSMGEDAISFLITKINELLPGGRKIALEIIGRSSHLQAEKILIEHLNDKDNNIRVCAAELLREQEGSEAIKALENCISNKDDLMTIAALQSLNKIGTKISFEKLVLLTEKNIYGVEILFAMAKTGKPEAVQYIFSKIKDEPLAFHALDLLYENSNAAAVAIEVVFEQIDDFVLEIILNNTKSSSVDDVSVAIKCLFWAKRKSTILHLCFLAKNESLNPLILEGLKKWGSEATQELEDILPCVDGHELASVVGFLSRLLDDKAGRDKIALFTIYLHSSQVAVATAAAGAMARFGDAETVLQLIKMTGSSQAREQRAAGHALCQIGFRSPKEVRQHILDNELKDAQVVELCKVFTIVGQPEDVNFLTRSLNSPNAGIRRAVLEAIVAISGSVAELAVLEIISLAMMDEDIGVQMAAVQALSKIGSAASKTVRSAASETIVSALYSAKGSFEIALVKALGEVGHPDASAILRPLCEKTTDVAMAALDAMQNLNIDQQEIQEQILNHSDAEVVKKALLIFDSKVSKFFLFKLLYHKAWDVRLVAVEKLSRLKEDQTVHAFFENILSSETNDLVRTAIAKVLTADGAKIKTFNKR